MCCRTGNVKYISPVVVSDVGEDVSINFDPVVVVPCSAFVGKPIYPFDVKIYNQ